MITAPAAARGRRRARATTPTRPRRGGPDGPSPCASPLWPTISPPTGRSSWCWRRRREPSTPWTRSAPPWRCRWSAWTAWCRSRRPPRAGRPIALVTGDGCVRGVQQGRSVRRQRGGVDAVSDTWPGLAELVEAGGAVSPAADELATARVPPLIAGGVRAHPARMPARLGRERLRRAGRRRTGRRSWTAPRWSSTGRSGCSAGRTRWRTASGPVGWWSSARIRRGALRA